MRHLWTSVAKALLLSAVAMSLPVSGVAQLIKIRPPQLPSLPKCSGDLCKAAGKIVNGAQKVGGAAVAPVQKAAGAAVAPVQKVAGTVLTPVQKAGGDVVTVVEKAGGDTVTTIRRAGGETIATVENASGDATRTIQHVGGATEQVIVKAGSDTITTIQKAGNDTITTVNKANKDVTVTVSRANSDITTNVDKGWKDTDAQAQRSFQDGIGAVTAVATFEKGQVKGATQNISDASRRVKEGKIVDALWGLGTEPLQSTDKNAATAVEESAVLNTLATVAAGAYGGPGGAAAYAAWLTYNETGNAELALRAGMLTGASSLAFSEVGEMPSGTAGEIAKKAIVGGAVGGLAVAAAGGDKEAVKNAFMLSGGMILVQTAYESATYHTIDARASNHEAYCMATVGAACSPPDIAYIRDDDGNIQYEKDANGLPDPDKPLVDVTKTSARYNHVGLWSTEDDNSLAGERGTLMTAVSKLPGMNAMAMFHDEWAVSWNMGTTATVSTIVPATVLTYVGTGAPIYEKIQSTYVDASKASPTPPVPNAYSCNRKDETRTVSVITSDHASGCHVIYRTKTGLSTPWNAKNDANYCASKTAILTQSLKASGWTCSPG